MSNDQALQSASARLLALPSSDVLRLTADDGATAIVLLHGGTVASWVPSAAVGERLFVSSLARMDGSAPFRGGIPLVFPRFAAGGDASVRAAAGEPPFPFHGFARTARWSPISASAGGAELELHDSEATRAVWPHAFRLHLSLTFNSQRLTLALTVENPRPPQSVPTPSPWMFEALMHTYIAVGTDNAPSVRVQGLAGGIFIDKPAGGVRRTQEEGALELTGEIDRIYVRTAGDIVVRGIVRADGKRGAMSVRATATRRSATPALSQAVVACPIDTVVWNPGQDRARAIADLGDDDWRHYVCIEPGRVSEDTGAGVAGELAPGHEWTLRMSLVVIDGEDADVPSL